jgi:hypothetical protein
MRSVGVRELKQRTSQVRWPKGRSVAAAVREGRRAL